MSEVINVAFCFIHIYYKINLAVVLAVLQKKCKKVSVAVEWMECITNIGRKFIVNSGRERELRHCDSVS